jgi:hypothetical protein
VATGQYFQAQAKWTPDRDDAYDFGIISKATKAARKMHIPNLELVLWSDESEPGAATPFEKFLLGLKRARRPASRPA